jgi:hypothetical protein
MFTLPDNINVMKANGEPKKPSTISIYKTHLNRISVATGLTTVEQFIKQPRKVIMAIKALTEKKDDESEAQYLARVRVYYSAIFMVLPKEYMETPNSFYRANQKYQGGKPADFKKPDA